MTDNIGQNINVLGNIWKLKVHLGVFMQNLISLGQFFALVNFVPLMIKHYFSLLLISALSSALRSFSDMW